MRARAAAFLSSVLLLALSGCADGDLFTPNREASTQLALRPVFAVNGSSIIAEINQVRVTIRQRPGDEVVGTALIDVDPASSVWNLPLEVPANADLRILIELLNVSGGVTTVQYSGTIDLSVTSGPQPAAPEVPVFPGGPENLSITGLTVSPSTRSILEGEETQLTANVIGGPTNPVVTWISLNSDVATVAANGTVTAVGPGSAVITAFAGRHSDDVTVQVGARATRVEVTPAAPVATSFGADVTFTGRVLDVRNAEVAGLGVNWSIADPTIATQVSPGVFRARRNGTTTVTATATQGSQTLTGTATLKVEQAASSVSVAPRAATLRAFGETATFTAVARDNNNTEITGLPFTWSSTDPAIASVDDQGVVTAHSNGAVKIRASLGSVSDEADVTVVQSAEVLTVTPDEHTLQSVGEAVQLQAALRDSRGNPITAEITWSSTLPAIATVSSTGLVTAQRDGVVVITARGAGANGSATIRVERVPAGVIIRPTEFEVGVGGSFALQGLATDANGSVINGVPVTWSSANPAIASVSSSGVVTGVHAGETDISASAGGASASSRVTVTAGEEFEPGAPFDLLIVSNSRSDNEFIVEQLQPLMPHVTIETTTAPTTFSQSELAQYRVILLFENGLWSSSLSAGNHLAQYVQNGGNIVIGTFYWQDRSDNPRYNAQGWGALEGLDMFEAPPGISESAFSAKYEYRSATLAATSIVVHPLTAGVTTLHVPSYPNGMEAKPGTTVLARYENGAPVIGFVEHSLGQRLIGITAWPAHNRQGTVSGDFLRIWTNALDWAAAGGNPVAPVGSTPSVPAVRLAPASSTAPASANAPKIGGSRDIRQ